MNEINNLIKEFCETEGHEFRGDYSGRFMYGQRCVGIVTDEAPTSMIVSLFKFLVENDMEADEVEDALKDSRTDNMGLSMIVYFPGIKS